MVLACADLSVAYGARTALADFSLTVGRGEIRTLIGPNGSGKSTALQTMAGLIAPRTGQALIDGQRVAGMNRRALARRLAFLPQQPLAPDEMTVEQLARQGRFCHVGLFRRYAAQDAAAIAWALDATGLAGLAARPLNELSGGERQRAWIAAALAQEAGILLLDEPTSFLDIGYQVDVLDLVHRLARDRGVTVVMAIHDINQALAISDRIALLQGGRLVFDGEPAALAASGLIQTVFGVAGRFVALDPDRPPHFDVALRRG